MTSPSYASTAPPEFSWTAHGQVTEKPWFTPDRRLTPPGGRLVTGARDEKMRITLKRQIAAIEQIVGFTDRFFEAENLGPEHRNEVDLALEEAFTNIVKYNPGGEGDILLTLERDDDDLVMSLTDFDAERFDFDRAGAVDIDQPVTERTPGGLGIHLIRKLMDRVDYKFNDREGTITMIESIG